MLVLGIDPGLSNLGLALYDTDADVFLKTTNIALRAQPDMECVERRHWPMDKVVKSFVVTLSEWLASECCNFGHISTFAVESQFKPTMCAIEGAALTLGYLWAPYVHAVSSVSVKKYYKLGCSGRHRVNKTNAVRKVKEMGYGTHDHNAADAMMLCLFYACKRSHAAQQLPV